MSNNWDSTQTRGVLVLTEQMMKEAQWWADNRYASVKEPYPVTEQFHLKE